ncbi:terminase [Pseudomonas sp. PDM16]|uniref:terminase n=1 Tax=Pseudomonas sp. PDM16 TaxID=2769292 RepID=UPI00298BCCC2|nr:terminase [Pseudomonas sp. PDM16]
MIAREQRAEIVREGEELLELHRLKQLKGKKLLVRALNNKWYRLNTLYRIKDKDGKVRRFRPNAAQRQRFIDGHCRDIILKARQLGFTTFEMIDALDDCLWTSNFSAGCIAHRLDSAKDIYRNKIRLAYEKLAQDSTWQAIFKLIGLRFPKPKSDKDLGYVFDNGSSIQVSTSYRGDTLQRLHVSEFGKICRKYPDKAQEIVTGAFEAVGLGNQVTLESTAEGREGYFFDYTQIARALLARGKKPTVMDWQFHFFPWHQESAYKLDPVDVAVPQWMREYFAQLDAKFGIRTSAAQQAWYAKKAETLHDDMKREYPSTPDEAFAQSVEGAYYAQQMLWLRKNGRITSKCKLTPALPVHTAWDLGMNDAMSIVFFQILGREVHIVDYLEDSGEGIEYYAIELKKKGYIYGKHFGPHDLAVREIGTGKSRYDVALKHGIRFEDPVPRISSHAEGIQAVRSFLPFCWFAETTLDDQAEAPAETSRGGVDRLIDCLDSYRKEWDTKLGRYKDYPRHDWASHGAKAFETMARCGIFEFAGITGTPLPSSSTNHIQQGQQQRWKAHT